MKNYLINIICRTGIFIICAQMLIHFRPKASYDKYLKMLVSAMILLQLFLPISELFAGKGEKTMAKQVEWFEAELANGMEDAAKHYEERLAEMEKTESYDSLEDSVLGKENIQSGQQAEDGQVWVTPVPAIPQINIHIGSGGVADADISAGNP